jgi:hypothetical protein
MLKRFSLNIFGRVEHLRGGYSVQLIRITQVAFLLPFESRGPRLRGENATRSVRLTSPTLQHWLQLVGELLNPRKMLTNPEGAQGFLLNTFIGRERLRRERPQPPTLH